MYTPVNPSLTIKVVFVTRTCFRDALHLDTDGDRLYSHLCRNLNQTKFERVQSTNTPTGQ